MSVVGPDGRELSGLPVGQLGYTVLAFHRAELHAALIEALPRTVRVLMGTEQRDDPGADLVIGADGLRSAVRGRLRGAPALRYSGETCWRAVVPDCHVPRVTETWGIGRRMGIVPLSRGRVYVFLTAVAPPDRPAPPWDELRASYHSLPGDCAAVLARLEPATLVHHDLWELDTPFWGAGRTWLLGDAAHAMTPNQGQGACMAIEDAAALALVVERGGSVDDLSRIRQHRVRKVQLDSRRFGQAAAWIHPLARWGRDVAMRATPESVMRRHYQSLVEPGLSLAASLG